MVQIPGLQPRFECWVAEIGTARVAVDGGYLQDQHELRDLCIRHLGSAYSLAVPRLPPLGVVSVPDTHPCQPQLKLWR